MSADDNMRGDAGHIALELLEGGPPEIEQRCFAARKAIEEGYLSLDEALEAYEIEKSDFVNYLLNIIINNRSQISNEKEPLSEETLKAYSMLSFLLSASYKEKHDKSSTYETMAPQHLAALHAMRSAGLTAAATSLNSFFHFSAVFKELIEASAPTSPKK
jgi:hypothetical protein